jgi:tRNA G37 N-methylase Trm5
MTSPLHVRPLPARSPELAPFPFRSSPSAQDARVFVRALAGVPAPGLGVVARSFDHIVMNLPASAVEFLDALAGAFVGGPWAGRALPLVHCYAFLRDSETEDGLRQVPAPRCVRRSVLTRPSGTARRGCTGRKG